MLTKLLHTVPSDILLMALNQIPTTEFRTSINEPTGKFFYDPWKIKPCFINTVWDIILKTLPFPVGEARIIILKPSDCYQIHADIDDRYHLNLQGESSYLIDLDNNELHKLNFDGFWYLMDAGRLHTATNFGRSLRVQIVVRKLLVNTELNDPVNVKITSSGYSKDDTRFLFDNTLSNWLNYANKQSLINDFKFEENMITFQIEKNAINDVSRKLIDGFRIEIL